MTPEEIAKLGAGDKVFWSDPDNGACSRDIVIQSIEMIGETVIVCGTDGTALECFSEELSLKT